jgi:hypothetical protein
MNSRLFVPRRLLRVALSLLFAGLVLAALWFGVAIAQAPPDLLETVGYNPLVADIIAQVTTPTLTYEMEGLTGERPVTVAGISYTIATRNSEWAQPISMTTRYAYEWLAATGLSVTYHNYTWGPYNWRNVVAEKPGLADPDVIYLITAHIDDMPYNDPPDAPGADDNASGSVAVMLAARLLAERPLAYTVRFVLFTGEEQGLIGSAAYAADCAARGEDIRGVINLDMIAYNSDALPIIDLYASSNVPASLDLTRVFSDVIGVYGLDLVPQLFDVPSGFPIQYSDQWHFLQQGYPAFLAIEDLSDETPCYHSSADTLSTLDLDYYADFTRAAIATLVHLGGSFPGVGWGQVSGTVADLEAGQPIPGATVSTFWPVYCYTFTTTADAGEVYTLSLPVGAYTLTVWADSPPYYSTVVTDVSVLTDTVTVQSFTLAPWPRQYFPMIAYDDD